MKLKTSIIVIAIIIIVLLGVVTALYFAPDNSTVESTEIVEENTDIVIMSIKEDIVSYTYKSAACDFKIVKDGFWYVENNENVVLSQDLVSQMLSVVKQLSSTTLVEENASELSKYGLDEPTSVISIIDENNTDYSINVGAKTSTDSGYYATANGEGKVFILSNEDYNIICGGLDSLRNKHITAVKGDVVKLKIKNSSGEMVIAYKETENQNAGTFTVWEMLSPYKKDVNQYIFEENVLNALNFAVDNFVDDNPSDYGIYGLSNPECSVEVTTTETHYTVYFGKTTEDGNVYIKTDYAPNVYSVNKELVKFKDYTPVYLLESLVFSRNISAVSKIVFTEDKTYVLEIDGNVYTIDGKNIEETRARDAYRSIISPVIQGEADASKKGNEICRFTFEYNTKTPSETVVFYEYDKMYSAVSVNGITEFYVKKSYVDDMINSIKKLSE